MGATVKEALLEFREAAIEKADGASPAGRDHAFHRRMQVALQALRAAGDVGAAAFMTLLDDESVHVRCWVAAELLSQGNPAAQAVLEAVARQPGLAGFAAQMTLKEHEAGRLGSPFL